MKEINLGNKKLFSFIMIQIVRLYDAVKPFINCGSIKQVLILSEMATWVYTTDMAVVLNSIRESQFELRYNKEIW